MFISSFNVTSTPLYLYANADILFDFGLIETTLALLCAMKKEASKTDGNNIKNGLFEKGIFVSGQRTNIPFNNLRLIDPGSLYTYRKQGRLFTDNAEDYFMMTTGVVIKPNQSTLGLLTPTNSTGHFMWDKVPDFVIGRPGYDNWLVAQALRWNVTLSIDFTRTVLAIHQTGSDGTKSGFTTRRNRPTLRENIKLAGRNYAFGQGVTSCLPWISFMSSSGSITFLTRPNRKQICTRPNYRPPRRRIVKPRMNIFKRSRINKHMKHNISDSVKGKPTPPMRGKPTPQMRVKHIPPTANSPH